MSNLRLKWTLLVPAVTAALAFGPSAGAAAAHAPAGPRGPASAARSATTDPTRNVTPAVDYYDPCYVTGTLTSTGCVKALVTDIDAARVAEGVKPLILPSDYSIETGRR